LGIERFEYQLPDEHRLDEQLQAFASSSSIPCTAVDTEHFLSSRKEVKQLFEGKKQVLMETFYRQMRKRYQVLMDGDAPVGGKWNYDAENRNKWKGTPLPPESAIGYTDVSSIYEEVKASGISYLGEINPTQFPWPVTRQQALQQVEQFVQHGLPFFGQFQDAMSTKEPFLFHSLLSFALNCKLISPLEVVQRAVTEWQAKPSVISLPQIEGFVRQIIGWREYMRGIYWWKMPEFAQLNYFNHQTKLPHYFWDADTKLNCVKQSVSASLKHAYAHHIQRLMVTGNFALLAGIHPDEVDAWYLGIYIDAIEWVEITNTRGMSQYADGGIVGSKPYISSANYMDKMSDYCGTCYYDKKAKVGDKACPFNSLYWHFFERNRALLQNNQRLGMMYMVLNKMQADERVAVMKQAEIYLARLEEL
jgi:deoxyribodipyrimidine photolyase-related protein